MSVERHASFVKLFAWTVSTIPLTGLLASGLFLLGCETESAEETASSRTANDTSKLLPEAGRSQDEEAPARGYSLFRQRLDAGASCAELAEIWEFTDNKQDADLMWEDIGSKGCSDQGRPDATSESVSEASVACRRLLIAAPRSRTVNKPAVPLTVDSDEWALESAREESPGVWIVVGLTSTFLFMRWSTSLKDIITRDSENGWTHSCLSGGCIERSSTAHPWRTKSGATEVDCSCA